MRWFLSLENKMSLFSANLYFSKKVDFGTTLLIEVPVLKWTPCRKAGDSSKPVENKNL